MSKEIPETVKEALRAIEFDGYEIDLTTRIKKDELDEILYYLE